MRKWLLTTLPMGLLCAFLALTTAENGFGMAEVYGKEMLEPARTSPVGSISCCPGNNCPLHLWQDNLPKITEAVIIKNVAAYSQFSL